MTDEEMREQAKADFAATAEGSARSVAAAYDPSGSTDIGGCGCM
jgi:hypothetical protein